MQNLSVRPDLRCLCLPFMLLCFCSLDGKPFHRLDVGVVVRKICSSVQKPGELMSKCLIGTSTIFKSLQTSVRCCIFAHSIHLDLLPNRGLAVGSLYCPRLGLKPVDVVLSFAHCFIFCLKWTWRIKLSIQLMQHLGQ